MTDTVTVSRELLRQIAEWSHLSNGPEQLYHLQKALRAALEAEPAPVQEHDNLNCKTVQEQQPVAWASQTALDIAAEGGEGIIVGAEADCLIPLYTVPQPVLVQEPVAEVKVKMTGGNAGIATVIHEIYDPLREPLQPGQKLYAAQPRKAAVTFDATCTPWSCPWAQW